MAHIRTHERRRARIVGRVAPIAVVLLTRAAQGAPCVAAHIEPTHPEREHVLAEARSYAAASRYQEARALYRWLLDRDRADQEAWLGAARVDAWEGCYQKAEQELREILDRHPHDVEARAALVDVLTWDGRFDDAQAALARGLSFDPDSPPLLLRKARYLHWLGDSAAAVDVLERAQRLAPLDGDLREQRQKLFVGQARGYARVDAFPSRYPSLYSVGMQGLHRIRRFELTAATLVQRYMGAGQDGEPEGRHSIGLLFHPALGVTAGLTLGAGLPVRTVPSFEARFSVVAPIGAHASAYFAYAFWQYRDNKTVHIFAPAVGYSPRDDWSFELRWWTSYVVLHAPPTTSSPLKTGVVHAASLRATFRWSPSFLVGAAYGYGVQLDENPAAFQLIALASHTGTAFADWMWGATWGVQPTVVVERRESQAGVVAIVSVEAGAYVRW